MQSSINFFLALIKWPVALLMVLLVVPAFNTIVAVSMNLVTMDVLLWFGLPCILMCAAWLFMPGMSGSFLAIMEHELTHMLFALLTFHPPVSLDVNQNKGGYFAFKGKGNWLIAIAPYFFPTFGFVVMLASIAYIVMGEKIPDMYWSVLGVMVGYHLASSILEIHPKQTDFKVAGYLFTLLFLPGANLIVYGILLSFASLGWKGVDVYFNVLNHQTQELLMRLMS